MKTYDRAFYDFVSLDAHPSASAVMERFFQVMIPESVIDFGCGEGAWLRAVTDQGVHDVVGVDCGIDTTQLEFPAERYVDHDLREPLQLGREFDLALCLETAEHLPKESADTLLDSIAAHAQVVIWSAALPLQGGDGHYNEQWPEYWIERFDARDFFVTGQLRWECWNDDRIAGYYRQNLLVFSTECGMRDRETFGEWFLGPYNNFTIRVVHPVQFGEKLGVRFL